MVNTKLAKNESNSVPDGVDDSEFSLSDIYDPRSKYTPEEKIEAVMAYVVTGNSKQASKLVNIPHQTIRWWKSQSVWWPDVIAKCRKDKNDELDGRITKILDLAVEHIETSLSIGEPVLDKEGNITGYKKPSAASVATILGILYDKRALSRGEPTSRTAKNTDDVLADLRDKFEQLSSDIQKKENLKIVSEQ